MASDVTTAPLVICIGPMPPPYHGAATMMAAVVDRIREAMTAETIDLSPGVLKRSLSYHLLRVRRHLAAARTLMRLDGSRRIVYVSVPGGLGQLYLLALTPLISRMNAAVFLHHHNYSYISRPTRLARLLFNRLGAAIHLTLCEQMTRDLRQQYGQVGEVLAVPNSWALTAAADKAASTQPASTLCITHLANLSVEKGLRRVVDGFRRLVLRFDVSLQLAGAFTNSETQQVVEDACKEFGDRVRYWGPVAGSAKEELLEITDVFVFPSDYANEAAPLVVDEALAAGAVVVSSPAGCLAELRAAFPIVQLVATQDTEGLVSALVAAVELVNADRSQVAEQARSVFFERQRNAGAGVDRLVERMTRELDPVV
ncbi:MAG: glycosyltransferase family 4 protein [Actinomycetota bacterium]